MAVNRCAQTTLEATCVVVPWVVFLARINTHALVKPSLFHYLTDISNVQSISMQILMNARMGLPAVVNCAPIFIVRVEDTHVPAMKQESFFQVQTTILVFVSTRVNKIRSHGIVITVVLFTILDGATMPSSISKLFSETLSLQCTANGIPLPTISWLKDNEVISTSARLTIQNSVTNGNIGNAISILSISQLIVPDEGEYSCKAVNTLPAGPSQAVSTTLLNVTESLWITHTSYTHSQVIYSCQSAKM